MYNFFYQGNDNNGARTFVKYLKFSKKTIIIHQYCTCKLYAIAMCIDTKPSLSRPGA